MKVAIVTPYFKETDEQLRRCAASVFFQTQRTDHIMVADGVREALPGPYYPRRIKLEKNWHDYGATPRAIGALIAVAEQYDAIGFLDADCIIDRDHVATCLLTAKTNPEADYIIARRRYVRLDGTTMPINDVVTSAATHVDTNCFFLLPTAYRMITAWLLIPSSLSYVGDCFFTRAMRQRRLKGVETDHITVNYTTRWRQHYVQCGETPPENAQELTVWKGFEERLTAELAEMKPFSALQAEKLALAREHVEREKHRRAHDNLI